MFKINSISAPHLDRVGLDETVSDVVNEIRSQAGRFARRSTTPRHVPGEPGVWMLIFGDLFIFGLFFITFSYYRSHDLALYAASQHTMHNGLGLTNTLLLLTSSWFIARGVQRARDGKRADCSRLILGALGCGIGFCVIKVFDYRASILAGISLNTNQFYTFYFMFTGIHLMHVLIGMAVLIYMRSVSSGRSFSESDVNILESCGVFWHLVDILWVFLFGLFYILG
jgi:nitric oxide reductase NorE protein